MATKKKRTRTAKKKTAKNRPRVGYSSNPKPKKKRRYTASGKMRKYRRRNPVGGATVKLPVIGAVNLVDVAGGTAGSIMAKMLPNLLASKLGLPITGAMKYPVQLASGLAMAYVAGDLLKMKGVAKMTAMFTINNILTDLANQYLVGPAGMGAYMGDWPPGVYLPIEQSREMESAMMGDMRIPTDNKGVFSPLEGVYEVGDVPDRFKSRF